MALHFWFCSPNAERMQPSAAASRSADSVTITAFLPPSSMRQGLTHFSERPWKIRMPTGLEPVNTTPSTPGCCQSASPISRPRPVTKLKTPAGTPASRYTSYSLRPVHGVSSAGLYTTAFPVMSAALDMPVERASGKLNGATQAKTP